MADELATAAAPEAAATTEAPAEVNIFTDWAGDGTGAEVPVSADGTAAAPAKEPEAPADDAPDDNGEPPAVEDKTEEVPEADKEPEEKAEEVKVEAPVVEFAPDEPFETFTEKVDKYFDAYELPPEIVAMREGYQKQIDTLQTQASSATEINDAVKATVEAVTAFDEFRKDDTGVFVPKTNEFITFVQANKRPEVFKQFVFDAMNAPSQKYKHLGYSMLHEYYADAGVTPEKMEEFVSYVSGQAEPPPIMPDLPAGVPKEVAEAYSRNSLLRKIITDATEVFTWAEETDDEYKEAKSNIDGAVAALKAQQKELNDDRGKEQAKAVQAQQHQQQFQQKVYAEVQNVQKGELVNFGNDLGEKLATFIPDPAARSLQVLSYQNLIVNALADDVYGEMARENLKAQGINIEFSKAQALFQQIQDAVAQKETIFAQTGDEKAASKAVEKPLTNALRELGVMRKNVIGKVAQVVTKSYTGAVKNEPISKKPSIRPVLKGGKETTANSSPTVDFLNPQEAGKYYKSLFMGEGA